MQARAEKRSHVTNTHCDLNEAMCRAPLSFDMKVGPSFFSSSATTCSCRTVTLTPLWLQAWPSRTTVQYTHACRNNK